MSLACPLPSYGSRAVLSRSNPLQSRNLDTNYLRKLTVPLKRDEFLQIKVKLLSNVLRICLKYLDSKHLNYNYCSRFVVYKSTINKKQYKMFVGLLNMKDFG